MIEPQENPEWFCLRCEREVSDRETDGLGEESRFHVLCNGLVVRD